MFGASSLPVEPIGTIGRLPLYGFQFFFQNMRGFRAVFWALTAVSVVSASLGFLASYLLGAVITDLAATPQDTPLLMYAMWYMLVLMGREGLDFATRRYAEGFGTVFSDHLRLRFLRTLVTARYQVLQNMSPERLQGLVGKYVGNVEAFLAEWFWGVSRRAVSFILVLVTLGFQDITVLAANMLFMAFFLALSFSVSARFAPLAARLSERGLESGAVQTNLSQHLASLLRLGNLAFFVGLSRKAVNEKWEALNDVRRFHARRWFLQLNLFNVMYAGTLFYGAVQVVNGSLSLGYLVLVRYAFDRLWDVLVYVIEYYVSLVQQREDSRVVRRELGPLFAESPQRQEEVARGWRELQLAKVSVSFSDPRTGTDQEVRVQELRIVRGERLGILGPSGIGKSTLLLMLLNAIEFEGQYLADGTDIRGARWPDQSVALVSNRDPLFRCSVLDNILLGREIAPARLAMVLEGLKVTDFCRDLSVRVGDAATNFSAGQEQRIRLARALVGEESLLLLDEPFNGIDRLTKDWIIDFISSEFSERTILLVTHHRDELRLVSQALEFDGRNLSRL